MTFSLSEFDRRAVRLGQLVTRDLIEAEEAYNMAKDRIQALSVNPDPPWWLDYYGDGSAVENETGAPKIEVEPVMSTRVEAWLERTSEQEESDPDAEWAEEMDINEWQATSVRG